MQFRPLHERERTRGFLILGLLVDRFGLGAARQAGVDRLEQIQPAKTPFDVAHQMLADQVGRVKLRFGLSLALVEALDFCFQVGGLPLRGLPGGIIRRRPAPANGRHN